MSDNNMPAYLIRNGWTKTQVGLYGSVLTMVPVSWLDRYNNPEPKEATNLLDYETRVDLDALWENIQAQGMKEPILLLVGRKSGTLRVEAGNQRVEMARRKGETHLPTITIITDAAYLHAGNGTHVFEAGDDVFPAVFEALTGADLLVAPHHVFRSLAALQAKGSLPDPKTYGT